MPNSKSKTTLKYSGSNARRDLPSRKKSDNKTSAGKALIFAGSEHMWGAALLCARACARSGAGYTYLFQQKRTSFLFSKNPDFLIQTSLKDLEKFQAVAIGPGLKDLRWIRRVTAQILKEHPSLNVVLDAEALNELSRRRTLPRLPSHWIITPHEGELARLLKISSHAVRKDRVQAIQQIQKKIGCLVILKGHHTLIASSTKIFEIQSGNSALAKAGTGDVLTGMIAGFLSQKVPPLQAACLAAFLHGACADQWIQHKHDHLSLLASDLIQLIPETYFKLRHSKSKS